MRPKLTYMEFDRIGDSKFQRSSLENPKGFETECLDAQPYSLLLDIKEELFTLGKQYCFAISVTPFSKGFI